MVVSPPYPPRGHPCTRAAAYAALRQRSWTPSSSVANMIATIRTRASASIFSPLTGSLANDRRCARQYVDACGGNPACVLLVCCARSHRVGAKGENRKTKAKGCADCDFASCGAPKTCCRIVPRGTGGRGRCSCIRVRGNERSTPERCCARVSCVALDRTWCEEGRRSR